jgi:hypothetical protein
MATNIANKLMERMRDTGYVESTIRKYGSGRCEQVRVERLTKAGFYLLTGTPDDEIENERIKNLKKDSNRYIKNCTYRPFDESYCDLVSRLHTITDNDNVYPFSGTDEEDFIEAVSDGSLTVLACDSQFAKQVSLSSGRINGRQLYRSWRLSNINALFMLNGFLTYLDRRPINTNWAINGVDGEASLKKYLAAGDLDISVFMQHALSRWYAKHPYSYSFVDPVDELTPKSEAYCDCADQCVWSLRNPRKIPNASFDPSRETSPENPKLIPHEPCFTCPRAWRNTPAFYSAQELGGFFTQEDEYLNAKATGTKNVLRHTFSGVGIGVKTNYIIHHSRPTRTPWSERIETSTIEVVANSLCKLDPQKFNLENSKISNAIIICASVHQFAALFKNVKKHSLPNWKKTRRVGAPYDSVSIVPINASGAMQLRGLLLNTPANFEMQIINFLCDEDKAYPFEMTQDPIFQLTYNSVPVLLAHSMDFQRLYLALEEYNKGTKFYVSCYPGQAKYIRKIMPDVEFL